MSCLAVTPSLFFCVCCGYMQVLYTWYRLNFVATAKFLRRAVRKAGAALDNIHSWATPGSCRELWKHGAIRERWYCCSRWYLTNEFGCFVCTAPLLRFLFEYYWYMLTCAGYSAYHSWIAHYDDPGAMSVAAQPAVLDPLWDQHGVAFQGWRLLHVGSVGTNGRQQLFYLAFAGQYHGLPFSRAGIDVFSRLRIFCFFA